MPLVRQSLKSKDSTVDEKTYRRVTPPLIVLLVFCCQIGFAQTWECASLSAPWAVRSGHSSISFNDRIFVLNGYQTTSVMWHDVWSSSDGVSWSCDATSVPYPMSVSMGCVEFDDNIWLYGGRDGC